MGVLLQCVFSVTPLLSHPPTPASSVHFSNAELFSSLFVSLSPFKLCPGVEGGGGVGAGLTFHNQSCLPKYFAKGNIFSLERNNVSSLGAGAAAVGSSLE